MRTIFGTLAAVVLLAISALAAEIKSTTKLTVTSDAAGKSTEITDGRILALSHVFAGTFLGPQTTAPGAELPRYRVTFDVQFPQAVKTAAYVVEYAFDEHTGEGYVHLPGRGEPSHQRNISTILRTGKDGNWFRASDEWNSAIKSHLP